MVGLWGDPQIKLLSERSEGKQERSNHAPIPVYQITATSLV